MRPDEVDQLVARYRELDNVIAVAREFGISRQSVGQHLAARGVQTARRISEQEIERATELYIDDGLSTADIGKRRRFNGQTNLAALRRVGVPIRPRNGY